MTIPEEPLRWKNSSSGEDTCVELAHTLGAVRDSKHPDSVLALDVRPLVRAVLLGQFDRN